MQILKQQVQTSVIASILSKPSYNNHPHLPNNPTPAAPKKKKGKKRGKSNNISCQPPGDFLFHA